MPWLRFPYESTNVRSCCWILAAKMCSRQKIVGIGHGAISAPSNARGTPAYPLFPACCNPTETHYIPGIPAFPQSLCWVEEEALPLSLFSFPPSLASSLAEPQDLEGGSRGGLGRAATSRAYPRPHFDLQYCLLISTSQMLLSSATERQIPEGEGSVVGREEMKAEKSRIY